MTPSEEFNFLITAALAESIGVTGDTFIYLNLRLLGIVSELALEQSSDLGGLSNDTAITIVTNAKKAFKVGESVIYKAKTYRIEKINVDAAGVELICVNAATR